MDLQKQPFRRVPAFTVRELLHELLRKDLVSEARQYLIEHPDLVFESSFQLLDGCYDRAMERHDKAYAQHVALFRGLLSFIWPLFVCAPLERSAEVAPHPELSDRFLELDIQSVDGLERLGQANPDLRAELVRLALEHLSEVEWSVLVLVAIEAAGDDSTDWMQERQVLIEYEAELILNTLVAWADDSGDEKLDAALKSARGRVRHIRQEVKAGNLRLHNMPLLRLVLRFVDGESWEQSLDLLRAHPELLTDEGLDEMRSHVESSSVHLLLDGSALSLANSAMHLDLLEKVRRLGGDSGYDALPAMPRALWVAAGLLQAVNPRIPSWEAYREAQANWPETLDLLARILRAALANPESRDDPSHEPGSPDIKSPPTDQDLARLAQMALLQFTLRATGAEAACLAARERERFLSAAMLRMLEGLPVLEATLEQDLVRGLTYLIENSSGKELLSLLDSIAPAELDGLASSGAGLFLALGALAQLATCESLQDRLACMAQNPVGSHVDTLRLLRVVLSQCSDDLRERLTSCESVVERASRIGTAAVVSASITDGVDVPDVVRAIFAWAGITDMQGMLALVREQPVLLSPDSASTVESILARTRAGGDPERIMHAQFRYAWLLAARREIREGDAGLVRPSLDLPSSDRAQSLILMLEANLPAGIWTPVSRVDLTDTFFAVLDTWIGHITAGLGGAAAAPLQKVRQQSLLWREQFGEPTYEHDTGLIEPLLELIKDVDQDALQRILSRYPGLAQGHAAVDILCDWRITARDAEQLDAAARIEDRITLLKTAAESSVEMAFLARQDNAELSGRLAAIGELMGIGRVDNVAELTRAFMELPAEATTAFVDKLAELIRQSGAPDAEEIIRNLRLSSLAPRAERALADGAESYAKLLSSEPLFADPAADAVMRAAFAEMPPEFFDHHRRLVKLSTDPLLRGYVDGTLTSEQQEQLNRLDALLLPCFFAPNWQTRFWLVAQRQELRTETAILRADMLRGMIRDRAAEGGASDEELLRGDNGLVEAIRFLERASEVAVHIAAWEKRAELAGATPDVSQLPYERLMTHLPPDVIRQLDTSSERVVDVLREAMSLPSLDDEDRAEVQARIGQFYKARHESAHLATDIDQAIDHSRRSVELSPQEGTEKALRVRSLALALLIRFEFHGHERADLTETVARLREAQSMRLVDAARGQVLGELGRALMTRYEADDTYSDLREAIDLLEEAIEITPGNTDDWIGWHVNLGAALAHDADRRHAPEALCRAQQVYREALPAAKPGAELWFSLQYNVASTLLSLGEMTGSVSDLDLAIRQLTELDGQSLTMAQRGVVRLGLGNAWRGRFHVDRNGNSLDKAIASFSGALDYLPEDSPRAAGCLNNLAMTLQQWEGLQEGVDRDHIAAIYERILALPLTMSWPHLVVRAAQNYGNYCWRNRLFAQARSTYERGLVALERMRGSARADEDRLRLAGEYAGLYARLVHSCLETGDAAGALKYALSAKSRAFADQLAVKCIPFGASSPALQTLRSEAEDIRARLVYLRATVVGDTEPESGPAGSTPDATLAEYGAEIARLQDRESHIWQELMDHGDTGASLAPATSVPSVAQVQSELARSGSTALEFFVDIVGWGVFVVSADQVTHVRLASEDPPWRDWVLRLFTTDYKPRPRDAFDRVLRELYAFFLAPLEPHLPPPGTGLVVAPTGMLNLFPLGAAMLPDGSYLLDRHVVSTVPSCHLLHSSTGVGFSSILTISHPGRKDTRAYIPFAEVEAAEISHRFGSATRLTGADLTLPAVTDQVNRHAVVHFACHGYFGWQQPHSSGLVLPNGNWITMLDILTRLRFDNTSLVVLSACDVGLEMPRPGDEHIGLVRALMVAGAPRIVASLWAVNDLSTMLLMRRFYAELASLTARDAGGVAEALRNAQRWLRQVPRAEVLLLLEEIERKLDAEGQEEPSLRVFGRKLELMRRGDSQPFAHPFYWASFQAVGDVL